MPRGRFLSRKNLEICEADRYVSRYIRQRFRPVSGRSETHHLLPAWLDLIA